LQGKFLIRSKKLEILHLIGLVNIAFSQKKYVNISCPKQTTHKEERTHQIDLFYPLKTVRWGKHKESERYGFALDGTKKQFQQSFEHPTHKYSIGRFFFSDMPPSPLHILPLNCGHVSHLLSFLASHSKVLESQLHTSCSLLGIGGSVVGGGVSTGN